jgi:hypothetical protein
MLNSPYRNIPNIRHSKQGHEQREKLWPHGHNDNPICFSKAVDSAFNLQK